MDLPVYRQDAQILFDAHVYLGYAYHRSLNPQSRLNSATTLSADSYALLRTMANDPGIEAILEEVALVGFVDSLKQHKSIKQALDILQKITDEIKIKHVLTEEHQAALLSLRESGILATLDGLGAQMQTDCLTALDNETLDEYDLDMMRHDAAGNRTTIALYLQEVFNMLDRKLAPLKIVNPAAGQEKKV